MKNIKLLHKSPETVIKLLNDYPLIVSEAKYILIHAEGLKILTRKHLLQRLPIALAQVKASNTSENLLTERKKVICIPCIEQKKLLKKYRTI